MLQFILIILFVQCFTNFCVGELCASKREKYLNGLIDYLNSLPNEAYSYEDGVILNIDESTEYSGCRINARIKANDLHNLDTFKYVKCTAIVKDTGDNDVSIEGQQCQDDTKESQTQAGIVEATTEESQTPAGVEEAATEERQTQAGIEEATEVLIDDTPSEHEPVKLDNEVQTDTAVTSGEQFFAVPRGQGAPCIGCASSVNPDAAGVPELASLGVTQLNEHEPNVRHSLNKVLSVERQVQVVNGVRYIMTVLVDYNSCSSDVTESCVATKPCKISVLEKPWVKLPDGSKYRAVVSNNCTSDWIFRDHEGLGNSSKSDGDNAGSIDEVVHFVHNTDVQSQPALVKVLTDDDIKKIQEQIISHDHFGQSFLDPNEHRVTNEGINTDSFTREQNVNNEAVNHLGKNSENVLKNSQTVLTNDINQPNNHVVPNGLSADKKKTIDDLMNFFDFSSFNPTPEDRQNTPRMKRSFDNDLKVFGLAKKFSEMKKSIKNTKYLYTLAQVMVDYLNEMDMEIKNRAMKTVISAEEETDVTQHFHYLQVLVEIPCQKSECDSTDRLTKICNGVIDSTDETNPHVLSVFCYDKKKYATKWGKVYQVPVNDPILQKMAISALKKIESESPDENALKLIKIMNGNTQKVHGTLTKITLLLGYTTCKKTESYYKRGNCTVERNLGSKICDIEVLQRKWLKENKINYVCTERPISESFIETKKSDNNVNDRSVLEIVQEALQVLEVQSNRNNKQKLVEIKSVSTQLVAGLLTNIDFTVGYTTCTNEFDIDIENCKLIQSEPLRDCQAQVWHRPWLVDGRQMNVSCNNTKTTKVEQDGLPDQELNELLRDKRSIDRILMTGGEQEQNPNNPKYMALAQESLQKYVATTGSTKSHSVTKVDRVVTQVVSGSLTKIDFTVIAGNSDVIRCHSEVWEQVWLNKKDIKVNCGIDNQGLREKRQVPGGEKEQNPNDPIYLALAQESLQKYVATTGSTKPHSVTKVDKVVTQVVSGSLTKIDFTVIAGNSDVIRCHSEVWEQVWLNKKYIKVNCGIDNQGLREKRQVPGGEKEQNPNDPKYLALAQESLQKYVATTGSTKPHSVTKIDRVVTQVVSGSLTKIDFTVIAGNSDVIRCHSEVWEQVWLNKKDIKVNCGIDNQGLRAKRQVAGGEKEQNPNDPKYMALAQESLQKYVATTGSTKPHSVTKVDRVVTQVVSGSLTKIDFTVIAGNSDVIRCHSEVWEQVWLNKKDIKVNCGIDNQGLRAKRQVAGGEKEQNPNDPKYMALAQESLQKYVATTGSTKPHSVTKIDRVVTQVVSGSLTKIDFTVIAGNSDVIRCHSEVWEQVWLNKKDIKVNCGIDNQGLRAKRQVAGGEKEQNPNDPKYMALAQESLQKYVATTGSTKPHSVTKVDRVVTQVVSGSLTKIDFTVIAGNSDVIRCHSEVWEQVWLNKKDIKVNCGIDNQGLRAKRQVAGGEKEQNPNDPKYMALAQESLQKYVATTGSTKPHSVTKIDRVVTQVVSGSLTKIDFTVIAGNSDVIRCHSEVWEQVWLNKKDIKVNCGIDNQGLRAKRQVAGGEKEQNPNDPKYMALAQESLQKYVATTGSTKPHSVTKIDRVVTQVVSGSLTKIDFTVIAGNSDVIRCHSEVWEQVWLNKKDIKVNCGIDNQGLRAKRQVAGGEKEQNPNDPKYMALAQESLQKYVATTGSTKPHSVTKIDRVVTQVVSGSLTKIDFTVIAGNSDVIRCHSEVWELVWLNKKDIKVNCGIDNQGLRAKRQVAGGEKEQNPNDPKYMALAQESLQKYVATTGSTKPHSVTKVDRVVTQVVSGSLTKIDFTVIAGNSDVIRCHSEVWEQVWLNKKDIKVSCGIDNQGLREKRQVPGGEKEQNPNDPKYLALAQESLQKYVATTGSTKPHSVTKIDRVVTQVVSGSLTKIDFTVIAGNSDVIRCHSEVWEQVWLNKKDIKVNCGIDNQGLRAKRQVAGGEKEQNPNDPKYMALAQESLQKYVATTGSTKPHSVTKIDRVVTQVVSGGLTKIDFTVIAGNSDVIRCHSEVWEQVWLNKKDIKVNCGIDNQGLREKRQVPGGEKEQNPNDPKYLALAQESLQKYVATTGSTKPHSVTKIDRVVTQVVSGSLTKIDFTVIAGNSDVIRCHSEVWEQVWLNKKDIKVNCGIDNQGLRAKRQVAGGEKEQNPNDPKYMALAQESLQKYVATTGSTKPHSVTKVDKVVTQVVSGSLTKIDFTVIAGNSDVIRCHSEVWEQVWLNKKDIKVNCGIDYQGLREKRQVPGGEKEQNPNDPKYLALAQESLQKYVATTGSTKPHSVTKVDKVVTQVVSGSLTKIDFTVIAGNSDVIRCHSEVWEQVWLNKKDIKVNCGIDNQGLREKRQVPGGEKEQNPNDPKYLALAQESLQKYVATTGSTKPHSVTKIDRVVTQVVSGSLTKIDFTVIAGNSDVIRCHSEVWEQVWLNKKDIKVNCGIDNQGLREKRQVPGGEKEQNPNDPKYLALAQESLQKYVATTGSTKPHSVTKVDKVVTQVVSGSLTKIDFTVIAGNSDVIRCHSEVWEQVWLNKKDIKVNCGIDNQGLREKRQAPGERMSGAPIAQDHTLPEYLLLAEDCLRVYLQNVNSTQHHKVVKVREVTTQPVNGVMTRLTFVVSPTNCQINSAGLPNVDSCEILDATNVKRCFAKVWDKPWKSLRTISVDCKIARSKRDIFCNRFKSQNRRLASKLGSEVEQDASKSEYKLLADESLRKYQQLKKDGIIHTVLEVKRVLTKLVSGTVYKIDFTATPSMCSKHTSNVTSCTELLNNQTVYCHTEIWSRPWLKRKDIDVDCNSENDDISEEKFVHEKDEEAVQLKSGRLGGVAPQDVTAERFKIMANAATRKFERSGKTKYVHKVVKVDEATEQIIDGSVVIIKFTASPTTCLIKDAVANVDQCSIEDPNINLQCTAHVTERIDLELDEDNMRVTCKRKNLKHKERQKRSIVDESGKFQNRVYDDDLDEETKYYYADRAVKNLNDHSSTHNLQKLVTIHSVQNSMQMKVPMVRMFIETAYTFCLRDDYEQELNLCEELDGMNHRLCLAKLFPDPDDELVIHKIHVVCDDDTDFSRVTGLSIPDLVSISMMELEKSPNIKYKLVHQGEPNVVPSLDKRVPVKLNFIVASTNCSKGVHPKRDNVACYLDSMRPAKSCTSYLWVVPNSRRIARIIAKCNEPSRPKRSLSNDTVSTGADEVHIKQLVQASLEKLEMSSLHRYKQRVLLINSYSTKITTGKVTTIDFDVGYTNCLKYEWIDNITKCEFLEHLPRRHCVSQVWERLWIKNGRNIEVNCEDDETPLESRIEFESAETAMQLAKQALKHIEAKYPHPKKQQVVRIFSLEKQAVAGMHFRMKLEVGFTNCSALSLERGCTLVNDGSMNRFCRVNIWLRPWTNHPPIYRVSCDYQDGSSTELYHHIQAEQLFYNFLATYKPDYVNDHIEMTKRFDIFKANVRKIHELNIYELGTATYAVNRFADLTQEEFSSKYLGLKPSLRNSNQVPMPQAKIPKVDVPEAFDWRTYGAVTPVKDQGSCGSCWAFSVTGNIEGQWKIQTGDLVSLSEQELVDCDKLDNGCNGGLPDNAYRAIEELGGLETETDYPYEGEDDKCSYNKTMSRVQISGAVNISSNETEMAQWLIHNGPISIGINANAMQFYRAGISHPWKVLCNPDNLDHGVLIVGFGVKDYPLFHKHLPYWIVKNSWGPSWGEEGYYRVFRGDGTCGVNKMASSSVI